MNGRNKSLRYGIMDDRVARVLRDTPHIDTIQNLASIVRAGSRSACA